MGISDSLAAWCERQLGSRPAQTLFAVTHLSAVTAVRLGDGRKVVIKLRPPAARLTACMLVQRHMWAQGYPCPELLAGPAPLGDQTATAEAYIGVGALVPRTLVVPEDFAAALARLVASAPNPASLPTLMPAPPWVGWNHDRQGIWPLPDDLTVDLNQITGPAWLDEAASRVRALLSASDLPLVIGHADWESQNLRWQSGRLVAVYDWDSIVALPEAMIAGAAAAVFPADLQPLSAAGVAESAAFLAAYAATRGRPWSVTETHAAWAAGIWVRAFNAKKAFVRDPQSSLPAVLAHEIGERMARAGLAA
jgi:hypothetical protein